MSAACSPSPLQHIAFIEPDNYIMSGQDMLLPLCRVGEQGEHLKSSPAAVARLQQRDNQAQSQVFSSQADSLLHGYQALLAQVIALHCQ